MFNLEREIIVVFSPYANIQARTLDVFDFVIKKHSSLRIEKICNILISNDNNILESLNALVKNEPESQVIIPFSYDELQKNKEPYFFRNRFRNYFYTRDLFEFEAPLKKDIYFFGRSDLIQVLINRFKSGENSGLFGLRKTGKTSLINGIERTLKNDGITSVIIDCQDTSFNQRRWNEALHFVCDRAKKILALDIHLASEAEFTEKNASIETKNFLIQAKKLTGNTVFIIFDEIENISRKTSPAEHWNKGIDFALFWQTLRSIFQSENQLLSYLIVGTNPSCTETPKIDGIDNPIFNHFTPMYIPGFEIKETREMVRKLGRRMGLNFDETVFSRLTEDFGGHPFLMRHLCSLISKSVIEQDRPVEISKATYNTSKAEFIDKHSNYLEMIISVLKDFYSDEYEMLKMLANDDNIGFNQFADLHHSYTTHLLGYGLIKKDHSGYDFNIEAVRNYILNQEKYQKIGLTIKEKWAEISERRNYIEVKLRKLIKLSLQISLGKAAAQSEILRIFGTPRKEKFTALSYEQIFDPNVSEIYFSDLTKIISTQWPTFKNSFERTKKEVFDRLEFINQSRNDAHAKEISDEQFTYFRICMSSLELDLQDI